MSENLAFKKRRGSINSIVCSDRPGHMSRNSSFLITAMSLVPLLDLICWMYVAFWISSVRSSNCFSPLKTLLSSCSASGFWSRSSEIYFFFLDLPFDLVSDLWVVGLDYASPSGLSSMAWICSCYWLVKLDIRISSSLSLIAFERTCLPRTLKMHWT